ncbi:MAG: hypothetical protein ABIQ95_05475 [Bdellovibrionia bacterium]
MIINQWSRLTPFLEVEGVPLDINLVEQNLIIPVRYLAGSFNYQTVNDFEVGDIAMSLTATARANNVEPVAYLAYCLTHYKDLIRTKSKVPISYHLILPSTRQTLAVNLRQEILGLLGLKTWVRGKTKKSKNKKARREDQSRETLRWPELIQQVEQQVGSRSKLIHVADREIDDYTTLSQLDEAQIRFVFRVNHNRNIQDEPTFNKLFNSLRDAVVICEREIPLSERKKKGQFPTRGKGHPKRKRRMARLGIAAKKIKISRAERVNKKNTPEFLELNFVRAFELDPPWFSWMADSEPRF